MGEHAVHTGEGITVTGTFQHYPWGDVDTLPKLLGTKSDGRLHAEWWIGTHPRGPARTVDGATLQERIGEIPVMMKLISCKKPLSLQIHPSDEQARRGWETASRDGGGRQWSDPCGKEETLHALEDFELLAGFCDQHQAEEKLSEMGWHAAFAQLHKEGIHRYLEWAWVDSPDVPPVPENHHLGILEQFWPNDRSLYVAAIMHHRKLNPKEQIHIPAGTPHMYIKGTGIELMTNSDNVVRGGFTTKPVDTNLFRKLWIGRGKGSPSALKLDWTAIRSSATVYTRTGEHAIIFNTPYTHLEPGTAIVLGPESHHTFKGGDGEGILYVGRHQSIN